MNLLPGEQPRAATTSHCSEITCNGSVSSRTPGRNCQNRQSLKEELSTLPVGGDGRRRENPRRCTEWDIYGRKQEAERNPAIANRCSSLCGHPLSRFSDELPRMSAAHGPIQNCPGLKTC